MELKKSLNERRRRKNKENGGQKVEKRVKENEDERYEYAKASWQ